MRSRSVRDTRIERRGTVRRQRVTLTPTALRWPCVPRMLAVEHAHVVVGAHIIHALVHYVGIRTKD